MKIKIESNGVSLKLSTHDENKNIEFKTIIKAYELVTGDELEITENEPATQEHRHEVHDDRYNDRPEYREPVKTEVVCPFCGHTGTKNVPFGFRFMNCPECRGKILLSPAAGHFGEKDERGFYYKAIDVFRDKKDEPVDEDLLAEMKSRMEAHEPVNTDE